MALCLGLYDDGDPIIGVIEKFLSGPVAVCNIASVVYDPHIRCYSDLTMDNTDKVTTRLCELKNVQPMDILYFKNKKTLSQRHTLV